MLQRAVTLNALLHCRVAIRYMRRHNNHHQEYFLFLTRRPRGAFPPLFLQLFLPTHLRCRQRLLNCPAISIHLLFRDLRSNTRPLFLILRRITRTICTRQFMVTLRTTGRAVRHRPLPPMYHRVLVIPFRRQLTRGERLRRARVHVIYFLTRTISFAILPFRRLRITPFTRPHTSSTTRRRSCGRVTYNGRLTRVLNDNGRLFTRLLFIWVPLFGVHV